MSRVQGTQSANPHNDYSQHFVDTGERPQNFIRDTGKFHMMCFCLFPPLRPSNVSPYRNCHPSPSPGLKNRFEEYPKLRELIRLKDEFAQSRATPPMYLRTDLSRFDLGELQSKFDVILIEPPLEEYCRMNGTDRHWMWDEVGSSRSDDVARLLLVFHYDANNLSLSINHQVQSIDFQSEDPWFEPRFGWQLLVHGTTRTAA